MNTTVTDEKTVMHKISGIRWTDILLCMLAFVCCRVGIVGGFYTIGVAYYGSLYESKELRRWGTLFALLGLLSLMSWNINTLKYMVMILFIAVGRQLCIFLSKKINLANQMLLVGGGIALINFFVAFLQGGQLVLYGIGSVEAIVGASLVYVFKQGITVIGENRKTPLTTKEATSMIAIVAALLGGMVDLYVEVPIFEAVYLRDVFIFVVLIGVVYLGGMHIGMTINLVLGSLLVMIGYMPVQFVAIYGIGVLVAGLFHPLGRLGIILGMGMGQVLGIAIFNNRVFDLAILGAYVGGALISLLIPDKYFGLRYWFGYDMVRESEETHLLRVQRLLTERLNYFVSAFEKFSKTFGKQPYLSGKLGDKECQYIIEEVGAKLCANCSMSTFCWEREIKATYPMVRQMLYTAEKNGILTLRDIPEAFKQHCIGAENFAYVLSVTLDLHKQSIFWKNRLIENRMLVGEQLKGVSTTLKHLVQDVEEEMTFNKNVEKQIKEQLLAEGIKVREVIVLEYKDRNQSIDIYTNYCKKATDIEARISEVIGEVLACHIRIEKHVCSTAGCYFKCVPEKIYQVSAGAANYAKEHVSGDVYSFMELENGQYLLALSDGMGHGKEAYEESSCTIDLLEEFMDSGFEKDTAIQLINTMLLLCSGEESFATMDMTFIDRFTGVAEFMKAGAATTFILRDDQVTTIRANSLPVGMLKEVDVEKQKLQLRHGDVVVMVTDGLLSNKKDVLGKEDTFKHFIKEVATGEPTYIANYLLQRSKDLLGVDDRDDMTVIAAKIWCKY